MHIRLEVTGDSAWSCVERKNQSTTGDPEHTAGDGLDNIGGVEERAVEEERGFININGLG